MVESLLECLNDLKSQYKLKGLDFESDLIRLYQKVRTMMTKRYITGEFGTVALSEVEGHDKPYMKAKIADENKAIKIGHDRIKQKIKDVRQDYRKTVNEGRRNGIGKLVINNWDLLKDLWGGSPATAAILNSCSTTEVEDEYSFDENENENNKENNEDNENLDRPESNESLLERDGERTSSSKATTNITEKILLEYLLIMKENCSKKISPQVNVIKSIWI